MMNLDVIDLNKVQRSVNLLYLTPENNFARS